MRIPSHTPSAARALPNCSTLLLPMPRSGEQRGSAYLVVLLALVVLTLLGLSLALITQSEVQIAVNELAAQRALYGAESGVHLAIARVLTVSSSVDNTLVTAVTPMTFVLPERSFAGSHIAQRVEVTPFVPTGVFYCDMCNSAYGDGEMWNVNHAVTATSARISWTGDAAAPPDDAVANAQKQLFLMVGVAPWWEPQWESIADPDQVARIRQQTQGVFQ